ncbi:MAG: hypothetical protein WKG00_24775 [Polyangiaceae bacterium]
MASDAPGARSLSLSVALALALAGPGCVGADDAAPTTANRWTNPAGGTAASSGTDLERYFPLVDGNIYHYVTEGDGGSEGLLVARAARTDARRGELRFPSGAKRFEYASDGVKVMGGTGSAYVLKAPLRDGATWVGEHGGTTTVLSADAMIETRAGRFTGCVQTLEEKRGDTPAKYATTFCPGTGIVVLEVASGAGLERAELKSYGPPIDLGPDGLTRTQQPGAPAPPSP